jgi:hypothetical protein
MPLPAEFEPWYEKDIRKLEQKLEATEIALKKANDQLWSAGLPQVEAEKMAA